MRNSAKKSPGEGRVLGVIPATPQFTSKALANDTGLAVRVQFVATLGSVGQVLSPQNVYISTLSGLLQPVERSEGAQETRRARIDCHSQSAIHRHPSHCLSMTVTTPFRTSSFDWSADSERRIAAPSFLPLESLGYRSTQSLCWRLGTLRLISPRSPPGF
jgi:hypothetical protein